MKSLFGKVYKGIGTITDALATVAMMLIFLSVFANVVMRYIFNAGFAWAHEFAQYAFVLVCLVGLVSATRDNAHFAVTIVLDRVPKVVRYILVLFIDVVSIVCTVWMMMGGFAMADVVSDTVSPAMGVPSSTNYYLLAIASIVMLFYEICNIIKDCAGIFGKKNPVVPEIAEVTSEKEGESV